MPSTYSPSLKLQLIGTGEQAGTWGTTTNYNLGTLLEQAITGVVTIPMGDANYTMTNFNGLSDEARNAVLVLNGPITSPQNLIAPAGQQKVYIVRNFTGNTVTVRTATGNGVALTNAASAVLFTDGTDFYSATTLNFIDGNLTVTGNTDLQGSVTMGSKANSSVVINANATSVVIGSNNIYANSSTGQLWLPKGNTASRTSSPIEGIIRYNTEAKFYEGYANGSWIRFIVANQGAYTINYVAVGGGGGGGAIGFTGGGGGAGKVVISSTPAIPGTTVLNISIGAGGAIGGAGSSTLITGIVDAVGGGGANENGGTSGNGYSGGQGRGPFEWGGGGGGGAGAAGQNGTAGVGGSNGGAGGIGLETLITGTSQYFGGGGGGWGSQSSASGGTGGGGGGGAGGGSIIGGNGTTNTGGGGGGGAPGGGGGYGGSGIVYLSMPTEYYTGTTTGSPTVTTTGGYTVLRYTGSGSYTA